MTPKTSPAIYGTIVQWLQIRDNFLLITGSAGFATPVVSGKKLKKKDAYASLANFINRNHNSDTTDTEAKNKYDWMLRKFKKANELAKTESDADALEKACPFYKQLDELFGERQNVNPSNTMESAIPEPIIIDITDKNIEPASSSGMKRKLLKEKDTIDEQESPTKRKSTASSTGKAKEKQNDNSSTSANVSGSNSSGKVGKQDFTSNYIISQKEKWNMDKQYKEDELKLQKEKLDKEVEYKDGELKLQKEKYAMEKEYKDVELKLQKDKLDKEVEIRQKELDANISVRKEEFELQKNRLDTEVEIKQKEFDANLQLRREEMEFQQNLKNQEVKQTKMQLAKEMMASGKTMEEIKTFFEFFN